MSLNPLPAPTANLFISPSPHEEHQYLNLIRHIIDHGEPREDRTGTGTISVFAPPQLRFSLRDNVIPLLTTKRVFVRAVIEELLWFIRGDTNGNHLTEKGIHIWDDKVGLSHRKPGDLGPVYGFQWRHFGAKYVDCDTDYTGQGVDQLREVIDKIQNHPNDRRIILSAWNPAGLSPGEFIHTMGDAHVYLDHIDALKVQLEREPRAFPRLEIKREITDINDFKLEDFEIIGYQPYGKIKMNMST
ncbi:8337_t:CDS:2 [Racocetra fulgida]|uniref:thymidylate synthase n=1 Tax=Racocetra fulgida TaxID=60492 RepID=A0A9N9BMQ3_9GLOM|nr:8337_t:CDS:2 [Racocetra fulgida]